MHRPVSANITRLQTGLLPLLRIPQRLPQGGLIGAGETYGQAGGPRDLLHEARLTNLAGARDSLNESPGFLEAASEDGGLRADEGHHRITQYAEYFAQETSGVRPSSLVRVCR